MMTGLVMAIAGAFLVISGVWILPRRMEVIREDLERRGKGGKFDGAIHGRAYRYGRYCIIAGGFVALVLGVTTIANTA